MKRLARLFLTLCLLFGALTARCHTEGFPEYLVKAQLLIRIAEFVQWPEGAFSSPKAPFVIAILGENPFGTYLEKLTVHEKVNEHPIQLRSIKDEGDISPCHLVFVPKGERSHLERLLAKTSRLPVLCVGDTDVMSRLGAHIGFLMIDGRIRFLINLRTARKSGLVLASPLLRLATRILDEETP